MSMVINRSFDVLLVEDNDDHAELIRRILANNLVGSLRRVSDGEEALDYLLRRNSYSDPASSLRPDIILLDLRLPKVDGLEVLQSIKTTEELMRIPVVVLTTSEAERDVAKAYDYRANAYLVKPVELEDFVEMLRETKLFWLKQNKAPRRLQE